MADFFANIDRVNTLADGARDFVWRSVENLSDFVHQSGHMDIKRRRREWFTREPQATMALWWVPA